MWLCLSRPRDPQGGEQSSTDQAALLELSSQTNFLGLDSCLSIFSDSLRASRWAGLLQKAWAWRWRERLREAEIAAGQPLQCHPPLQGANGTFLLSLTGTDAEAFNVSPERAAVSVSVQVVVKNSEMVDYEKKTEMHVQVRCAEMLRDTDAMGS